MRCELSRRRGVRQQYPLLYSHGSITFLCTLKSIRVYDLIHRVFGHPYYGSNGEEPTLIKFTLQHTDYKSVGAYRKFSGDHLKYQIISSSMRISKPDNGFTRYYSA